MNIGSLFKSMIGESKPGEIKQLDLRAGQVVRGVVQSVSDDGKEAVVQIQGVKVSAKLETPLQTGQTAFMQVQPATEDGSIVMKPVAAPPGAAAAGASMEETLKQVGLPDNKQNREMIRMMQQAEIPVTREQTAEIRNLLAQKPAAVDAQQFIRSIGILQQRGLPVTPQSVAGMQQAVFGPPASALLNNLEQQVAAALAQLGDSAGDEAHVPGRIPGNVQPGAAAANGALQNGGSAGTGMAAGQTAAGVGGNPIGAGTAGNVNTGSPISGSSAGALAAGASAGVLADAAEGGPQAQARPAAQAASGAVGGAGNAAEPDTAPQASGSARTADSAASAAAVRAGANQAPAAGPAPQGAPGTAAPQAGASASASSDAVLLRKVQALLGELRTAAAGSTGAASTAENPSAAAAGQAAQQAKGADADPWVGRLLKMLGTEHEQQTARSTLLNTAPSTSNAASAAQQQTAQTVQAQSQSPQQAGSSAQPQQAAAAQAAGTAAANTEAPEGLSAAVRSAADQALRALQGEGGRPDSASLADDRSAPLPAGQQAAAEVRETLKSLLLQLSASDSLPAGLKDAAQQAVQQMTGQQLLLNTDRTAPFAQVTMFLPFVGPDGSQTAAVQIESRRGPKGELDASNCRLWFDLEMKALGRTVIDVQVVDRNVSLNFRNDEEWAGPLLEAGQAQIAAALESAGYQLMALRTDTLPVRSTEAAADTNASLSYTPPSYRGVDVKI
ncbi:hypothetical protein [Saccharibacillus kuerlensis]|nr:hypothetical protein [Saccharibacillus kuerlensis]